MNRKANGGGGEKGERREERGLRALSWQMGTLLTAGGKVLLPLLFSSVFCYACTCIKDENNILPILLSILSNQQGSESVWRLLQEAAVGGGVGGGESWMPRS